MCVIISHASEAKKRGEYLITDREIECERLEVPYMTWESKDISAEEKFENIKLFFAMVA